jgi:hypothetical protein
MATAPTLRRQASRSACLDGIFSPQHSVQECCSKHSLSRSSHSVTESIDASMSAPDSQQAFNPTRPLNPVGEEELEANSSGDDSRSVFTRSLTRSLNPRLCLRNLSLRRRSEPQVQRSSSSRPTSSDSTGKISPNVANFFQEKQHSNTIPKPLLPLPAHTVPPPVQRQKLTCHRCYYFAARNCKGWTMGGSFNDACETCLVSFDRVRSHCDRT